MRTLFVIPPWGAAFLSWPTVLWSGSANAQDQDHVAIGAVAAVVPTFQGSKDYRVLPLPAVDIKEGRLFANLRSGLGVAPVVTEYPPVKAAAEG